MAEPYELKEETPEIATRSLDYTGWTVPRGWYGFVPAAGVGIVRLDGIRREAGMTILEQLAAPDIESRSDAFEGRRMVRINGGFLILNYFAYRERDFRRNDPSGAADSYVYYARCGDQVKIGLSKNPWARVNDLKVGRPGVVIAAVERGGRDHESLRHEQFRADRLAGEWFLLSVSLAAHIRSISVATSIATKDAPADDDAGAGEEAAQAEQSNSSGPVATPGTPVATSVATPVATKEGRGQRAESNNPPTTTADLQAIAQMFPNPSAALAMLVGMTNGMGTAGMKAVSVEVLAEAAAELAAVGGDVTPHRFKRFVGKVLSRADAPPSYPSNSKPVPSGKPAWQLGKEQRDRDEAMNRDDAVQGAVKIAREKDPAWWVVTQAAAKTAGRWVVPYAFDKLQSEAPPNV